MCGFRDFGSLLKFYRKWCGWICGYFSLGKWTHSSYWILKDVHDPEKCEEYMAPSSRLELRYASRNCSLGHK